MEAIPVRLISKMTTRQRDILRKWPIRVFVEGRVGKTLNKNLNNVEMVSLIVAGRMVRYISRL